MPGGQGNGRQLAIRITACRTQQLQDISPADAHAEGYVNDGLFDDPRAWFQNLWDTLHAARDMGWKKNPLVWVVHFENVSESKQLQRTRQSRSL